MQLTEVKFRNINSYGNRWQTINFDPSNPGLYQICGENGTGKSTISQVLKLGLYGRVQGGKTKTKCVNRINKAGEISIVFETRLGKVEIDRGISPDYFKLKLAGNAYEQAGIKNVQNYLEENLIGIPQNIFNNSISLSINDFKSFLKMSAEDKREIVDKIFGLESLNKMKKLLSDETKEIKDHLNQCESGITLIEQNIAKANNQLSIVEEKLKEDNSEKINSLNEEFQNLNKLREPIEETRLKATESKEKLDDFGKKLISNKQALKSNIDSIARQKKLYESDKCPTCGSSLDSDEHKHKYEELLSEEQQYKEKLKELDEKSVQLDQKMKKAKDALNDCNNRLMEIQSKGRSIQAMIKDAESQKINQQTDGIQRIIEENIQELEEMRKKRSEFMKISSLHKLVDEILGEKGLKKSVMEHIVKPMNTQVNTILAQLELPFKVEFDGKFDAKLKQLSYEISTEELSTGQLKMLDFSVLLAIIKMLKIKFPTLNILFLDEIFSSLDPNNIGRIVHILRKIAKEYGMNIMVINHAPLPTELFDWTITTSMKDNFSNLIVEKCT